MDKLFIDNDYTASMSAVANIRYGVEAIDFRSPKRTSQRFSGLALIIFLLIYLAVGILVGTIWIDSASQEHRINEQSIDRLSQ